MPVHYLNSYVYRQRDMHDAENRPARPCLARPMEWSFPTFQIVGRGVIIRKDQYDLIEFFTLPEE